METKKSEQERLIFLAKKVGSISDPVEFCFEALKNIADLVEADKCSLFLVRDTITGDGKELASKLWNVTPQSNYHASLCDSRNEFVLPFGVGIAGHAASKKTKLNVPSVYEDSRFSPSVDEKTGYCTRDVLCYPVITPEDDKVVALVEVVNKRTGLPFNGNDERILDHFIVLCSLALQHTKRTAKIVRLEKVTELQQDLSSGVAKRWAKRNYDDLLKDVVVKLSTLIDCERYTIAVSLNDGQTDLPFSKSYDLLIKRPKDTSYLGVQTDERVVDVSKLKKTDWIFSHKVIEMALEKKEIVNLSKIHPFSPYKLEDEKKGFSLKTVLCLPFYDSMDRLLGIVHLANKRSGFQEDDEHILQTVAPYITNGLLFAKGFNSISQHKARTEIAHEMMLYHAQTPEEEFDHLKEKEVPTAESLNLYDFKFSDLSLEEDDTVLAAMRIFTDMDVFYKFKVEERTMLRWLLSIRRCYRPVPYHNWRHGFNVAHMMFLLQSKLGEEDPNSNISNIFTDLEKFALVVACFCHDIDHRGTNNAFLIRAGEPLAVLYNTSTLENHHYKTCVDMSNVAGCRIFDGLSDEEYTHSCDIMKDAILATDLALYYQRRNSFKDLLEKREDERNFHEHNNKMLLMSMMMTACDLSSITKPWEVQREMAYLVTSEFYEQGDQERAMFGTEPIAMMDRSKKRDLPKMQIGFIDGVCALVYKMMADFCPRYKPLRESMLANRNNWNEVAKKDGLIPAEIQEDEPPPPDYINLWEQYWNMDPENFIWGIDPNEAPPEVVIERVVLSPKKNKKYTPVHSASNGEKCKLGNGKRMSKKNSRKQKSDRADEASSRVSKKSSTSTSSDGSNLPKNSKLCIIM